MPEQSPRRHVITARLAILAVAFVAGANVLRPARATTIAAEQPVHVREQCRCLTVWRPGARRLPVELRMRIAQRLANGAVIAHGG